MSSVDLVLPMATFALAAACTPGPNNIMLTASGVNFGFARSFPHMAGIVIGFALLIASTGSGLQMVFAAFPAAHGALKVAGVVYMLWLAHKVALSGLPEKADSAQPLTFVQAAAFQWINPKGVLTVLSATALFIRPQFAGRDLAMMLAVFSVATVISVVIWTGFGTVLSRALTTPRQARIFNIVMALLLVASIIPMVW